MRSFAGKTIQAITLGTQEFRLEANLPDAAILTNALTDNYLKLRLRGNHAPNQWLQARITGTEDGELVGRPEPASRDAAQELNMRPTA